jgi:hypothetical protein
MSSGLPAIAHDKELLLMRSALCRLRLRRASRELRSSLHWRRAAGAAAAPAVRRIAFGLALSLVGLGRAARMILLASRVLLVAGIARSALAWLRKPEEVAVCAIEQTEPAIIRSLGDSPRSSK